ncbi:C69 family dipeptidase [Aquiflexum sp. TKW24L]|uniref:C69 family dipeptidase n=1 Tax=Aquiflexum sp. TKW24L TaxID=2942212 RepID=UPI0020BE37D8|nr:C69 family dipeptidase [Aquiflexum sp. TKW24L]MCL6259036.1 C69 family dipeptidase [Aquiflexum sp. TKW24L]
MCDTLVGLPHFTKNKNLILAKNSDREPDEAQALQHFPRISQRETAKGTEQNLTLNCTYISIPQVEETYEVLLSKPFQMWGAEMGVNEFGVVIGNEAIFTNVKIQKQNTGLTGMDMLRLALERNKTAKEAVNCITTLLSIYGQNACGGYKNKDFYYHNSYIIADPKEAYILETAGKSWASRKVESFASISNGLSIETDYENIHLEEEKRNFPFSLKPKPNPFSFRYYFSDFLYTKVGRSKIRQACSSNLLSASKGDFTTEKAMQILRTHNLPDPQFSPKKCNTSSLCMHATGLTNPSTTTGSMVVEIRTGLPSTVWMTGTSMPCLSVYIPFFMGTKTLDNFLQPGSSPDNSLWWKAEKLHRWISEDYQKRKTGFIKEAKKLEEGFLKEENKLVHSNANASQIEVFSGNCLHAVKDLYSNYKI